MTGYLNFKIIEIRPFYCMILVVKIWFLNEGALTTQIVRNTPFLSMIIVIYCLYA